MSVETKEQVEQFINLQQKNQTELRAICEGMGMKTQGDKPDLIERLLEGNVQPQRSVLVAQAIPLRTRDNTGQPIKGTIHYFKVWRKLIFDAKTNRKNFQLLNRNGEVYQASMKYIKCPQAALMHILSNGWFLPLEHHRDIISMLKQEPEKFETNIVQKHGKDGNSWLMLHVALAA